SLRGVSDLERGLRRLPYPDTVDRLITALGLGPLEQEALRAARRSAPAVAGDKDVPLVSVSRTPVPLTSFIGRAHELLELERLLSQARLVTVVGAGGVGKTRLAIELAHRQSSTFAHGVHFVALAGISSPSLLASATATALGVPLYGS